MPNRPHKEHHVHHPAHNLYLVAIVCTALVVVMGFTTVFIPWAVKDIAVGTRAWAFPFKTCLEDTFSAVNAETCEDNDFIQPTGVPLTGNSAKCKAYILATIAFVFLSVLPAVILLIILGYILEHLWWHPKVWALVANIILAFVCISCFLAWGFFIVYMQATCAPNSIFPVSPGYSYGWIMYLFLSPVSVVGFIAGLLGSRTIHQYQRKQAEFSAAAKALGYPEAEEGVPYISRRTSLGRWARRTPDGSPPPRRSSHSPAPPWARPTCRTRCPWRRPW